MWLENAEAVAPWIWRTRATDSCCACSATRTCSADGPEKSLAVDLAIGLMRAVMPLAERAARLPAGPSNPACNAGMSFVTLRDAACVAPGSRGTPPVHGALPAAERGRRHARRRR